jgi:hypothetical protein
MIYIRYLRIRALLIYAIKPLVYVKTKYTHTRCKSTHHHLHLALKTLRKCIFIYSGVRYFHGCLLNTIVLLIKSLDQLATIYHTFIQTNLF